MVGRPIAKFEINLNKVEESVETLKQLCSNTNSLQKVKTFIEALNKSFKDVEDKETQTSTMDSDSLLNQLFEMNDDDVLFIFTNIWKNITGKSMNLFKLYLAMTVTEQCHFFKYLGSSFNRSVWEKSLKNLEKVKDSTFEDLCTVSKTDFYDSCDPQLQYFFKAITKKDREKIYCKDTKEILKVHSNINELANIWDNLQKARNNNYISMPAVCEGLVSYISSGKSHYNLQIMQKLGGHGSKPVLERTLQNTEKKCKFVLPKDCTIAFTFDNIQQLYRSHRIAFQDQGKILAIIVCSMLCHLVDGFEKSKIQYEPELAPSTWFYNYKYNSHQLISLMKSLFWIVLHLTKKMRKL